MPASFDPGAANPFGVARFSLLLLASIILLALWAVEWLLAGRRPEWRNGLHWPVLALVGWLAIATLVSEDPRTGLFGEYREYAGLISSGAFAVVFFATAQAFRGGRARTALQAMYFGGGGIAALYGILQLHDRCLAGPRWDPVNWATPNLSTSAIWSTLGNPNHLSAFFAILMPIGLALAVGERRRWALATIAVLSSVMLVEIVHAQSRAGLLALLVGVAVACVLLWQELARHRKPVMIVALVFVAALFAIPSLFFGSAACPGATVDLAGRIRSVTNVEGRTPTSERLQLWRAAGAIGVDHPLTGVGPSAYRWYVGAYQGEQWATMNANVDFIDAPHNTFLVRLTDGGLPAVGAFAAVLAMTGAIVFSAWRFIRDRDHAQLARLGGPLAGAAAGVAAFVVQASFNVEQLALSLCFWYLLGLTVAAASDAARQELGAAAPASRGPVKKRQQPKRGASREREPRPGRARVAAAVAVLACTLIGLALASAPYRADRGYRAALAAQRAIPRSGDSRPAAIAQARSRYSDTIATYRFEPTYPANYAAFLVTVAGSLASTDDRGGVVDALREARTLLEDAIGLQPRNHLYHAALGAVLLKTNEFAPDPLLRDAGVAAIRRAMELHPWRAAPAITLAQALATTPGSPGEKEMAIIERALMYSPRNVDLVRMAARLEDARGERTRAKDLWRRLLDLVRGDAEAERALLGR